MRRWLWTRCRRCCYYGCLLACSLALLVAVATTLGINKWLLSHFGLTHGDEMAAQIPLETQGKLHFEQDEGRQVPPALVKHIPHSPSTSSPSHPPSLDNHSSCISHSTHKILFFVRIPKCASTSFVDLLRKLSKQLDFYLEFNPSGAYNWKEEEMRGVALQISRKMLLNRNLVYARHFYFVDFTKYGIEDFSYLTIIRDPIDRVVSSYLYYHFSSKKHIQNILSEEHRNESLSTCLRLEHEGCTHNLVTKYFCGHAHWCKYGDKRALKTAKKNLVNHFAVVGIMEEMGTSVKLMTGLLPQFFNTGTGDVLTLPALNKNERTASLSQGEREEIAAANSADVQLYDFAVQLLHDQALKCGLR